MSSPTRFRAAADDALRGVRPLDGAALRARARRRQVRATAAGVSLAALAAGCVVLVSVGIAGSGATRPPLASPSPSASASASTAAPTASAGTAPPREIRFGFGATLRTDVSAAQRAAAVPEERAVAALRAADAQAAELPRTVVLGVLRDVRFDAEDGSTLEGRLVWAVVVPDAVTRNGPCDVVVLVDARTGSALGHFEEC